jgi:hypothetical protein
MKQNPISKLRDAIVNFFTDEWCTIEDKRHHLPTAGDFEFLLSAIEATRQRTIPDDLTGCIDKLDDYLKKHKPERAIMVNDFYDGCHFAELADEVLQGKGTFAGTSFSARQFCKDQGNRRHRTYDSIQVSEDINIVEDDS